MRRLPILFALLATPALASSEDAWQEFRQLTESSCLALIDMPVEVTIEVNPFGSDQFGVALLSVTTAAGTDRMACIMNKQTGAAELTAPFTNQ